MVWEKDMGLSQLKFMVGGVAPFLFFVAGIAAASSDPLWAKVLVGSIALTAGVEYIREIFKIFRKYFGI